MQHEFLQSQLPVKIHVVEMHKRQHSGIGGSPFQMHLNVNAFKFILQAAGNQPSSPFVEVTHYQPRVLQSWRQEDFAAHQHVGLLATLQIAGTEMDVKNMYDLARG